MLQSGLYNEVHDQELLHLEELDAKMMAEASNRGVGSDRFVSMSR